MFDDEQTEVNWLGGLTALAVVIAALAAIVLVANWLSGPPDYQDLLANEAKDAAFVVDCYEIQENDFDSSSELRDSKEGCAEWVGIPEEFMAKAIGSTGSVKTKEVDDHDPLHWYYVIRAHFLGYSLEKYAKHKLTAEMLESPLAVSFGVIQNEEGVFFIPQVDPARDPSKAVAQGVKAYSVQLKINAI